jgi:cobalt-zinc-cadmium efflux system protein
MKLQRLRERKEQPWQSLECECGLPGLDGGQPSQKFKMLWVSLGLLSLFFGAELSISLWSGSLSLLADTGHLVCDIGALGLTLLAAELASRPATPRATFGYRRLEVLAALVNGLGLVAIAGFIAWEAIVHLQHPDPVLELPMLIGSVLGLGLNSLNITLLHPHSHDDLNLQAVLLHMIADVASSVGVLIAALTIYLWHWEWMDAGMSLVVALLTAVSAIPLLRDSFDILLEYAPRTLDMDTIEAKLLTFEPVHQVKNLYGWTISANQVMLSASLDVDPTLDAWGRDRLLLQVQTYLFESYGLQANQVQIQMTSSLMTSDSAVVLHPMFQQTLMSAVLSQTGTSNR